MTKLNTYLNFAGNAEEAFNFYKSVFGGQFSAVVRFKDMPMEGMKLSDQDANKIMHIGLPVGNDQNVPRAHMIPVTATVSAARAANPGIPGRVLSARATAATITAPATCQRRSPVASEC